MLKDCCCVAAALLVLTAVQGPGALAACPGETQVEMNACAGQDYAAADERLNAAYRKLDRTPELVAAEKAWIAFRDAQCAYEAKPYEGGSIQPSVLAGCLQALTEDRIKQLQEAGLGQ